MQVKILFERWEDKDDYVFFLSCIDGILVNVDELIFRTPDYIVRGKRKLSLTLLGLSKNEADRIYKLIRDEMEKAPEIGITRVFRIKSSKEEDTGEFLFYAPEYKEGVKEELEGKKGYGLDVPKLIRRIMYDSVETIYPEIKENDSIALRAAILCDRFSSKLDPDDPDFNLYLTELIASEEMEKDPPRRRPRAPKSERSPRKGRRKEALEPESSEYSDKNNLES